MNAEMLYRILLAEIEGDKRPVHSPMPTEAALCAQYGLARGTVRAALQRLTDEGYVRAGQGRQRVVQQREPLRLARLRISSTHYPKQSPRERGGTSAQANAVGSPSFGEYLRTIGQEPNDIVLRSPGKAPCYQLSEEARFDAGTKVGETLGVEPDSEVIWFLRLRLANDRAIALQWAVIPAHLVPTLPSEDILFPGGLTSFYERHGIRRKRVHSTYSPARASRVEANYLGVSPGAPLIEERRVSFFSPRPGEEVAYEYLVSLYTERVALTFEWIDPPRIPTGRDARHIKRKRG